MYKAIKRADVPEPRNHDGAYAANDIRDFVETGYAAAEVMPPAGRTPSAVYQVYHKAAKRFPGVTVRFRGGKIYLIKD